MPLRHRFSLRFLWLHWVVLHAGVFGTYGFALDVLGEAIGRTGLEPELGVPLAIIFGLTAVGVWAWLQQLVLTGGGMRVDSWVWSCIGGLIVSFFGTAIFSGFIALLIPILPRYLAWPGYVLTVIFAFGAILGMVQATVFKRGVGHERLWTVCSGLGSLAAFLISALLPASKSAHLALLVVGFTYGMVTACGVVWLAAHPIEPDRKRLPYIPRDEALQREQWHGLPEEP